MYWCSVEVSKYQFPVTKQLTAHYVVKNKEVINLSKNTRKSYLEQQNAQGAIGFMHGRNHQKQEIMLDILRPFAILGMKINSHRRRDKEV